MGDGGKMYIFLRRSLNMTIFLTLENILQNIQDYIDWGKTINNIESAVETDRNRGMPSITRRTIILINQVRLLSSERNETFFHDISSYFYAFSNQVPKKKCDLMKVFICPLIWFNKPKPVFSVKVTAVLINYWGYCVELSYYGRAKLSCLIIVTSLK